MGRAGPTIHDVARAVGVSATTVSRALSHPHLVAAATVARVQRVRDELGYSPSPQARWLHTGRSDTLSLVLPDITNPFFFDLIRGAQHEAASCGFSQLLVDTEESIEIERAQLSAARKATDGIVHAGPRLPDAELAALSAEFPMVTINRRVAGVPHVVIDTLPALTEAVEHLADLGHARIAYLGGPTSAWFESRRWRAIRSAAERRGLTCRRLGSFPPTMESGQQLATPVRKSDATAVLTYNDLQALGLMHELRRQDVQVPADVSVVGCDDIFGAALTTPGLTTVSASAEAAGRLATQALVRRLAKGPSNRPRSEVVPASLTIRGSTGPPQTQRR